MSKITLRSQASDPPTPATGEASLYIKAKVPHVIDDAGLVTDLTSGGGGSVSSVHGRTGVVVAATSDYDASQVDFTPDGDIAATNAQSAIVEVRNETDTKLSGKLATSHEGAGGAAHADAVAAGASGFMTGAQVTKLAGITAGAEPNVVDSVHGRTGAVAAAASDYDASQVDFTPSGDIAATDVQAAIVEVRDDADTKLAAKAAEAITITAGTGLTGGGDLSASRTLNVVANADASITVNANNIQVGVLADDGQHGLRGGGTQHADAIAAGASGFMTGSDKTKLNGIAASADVSPVASVFTRIGAVVAALGDYTSSLITNASTVAGATVTAALDTIATLAGFMVPLYDLITLLPVDIEITESAGNIVCTLTDDAGALFVTGRFGSESYTIVTPATVNLTAGTATVPATNYVFLTESVGVLTLAANTTGFPVGTLHLAEVFVQSSTEVAAHGPLGLHIHNDDPTEHIHHIGARFRVQHAEWRNGVAGSFSVVTGPTPDDVFFSSTAGEAFQLHNHTIPAFDMSTGTQAFVMNDPTTPWTKVSNLNGLLTDSEGVSMSGRYFSLTFVVIINQDSGESKLLVCLPAGSYNSATALAQDASKFAAFAIPVSIKGNAFLVSQGQFRHQTAGGGQHTLLDTVDLRSFKPAITAGGSTASPTEFDDSVHRINNTTDPTKQIAHDASGIATGTTRTVTVPDFDCEVSQARSIRETSGPQVLVLGAVADGQFVQRSGTNLIGATPAGSGDVVGPASATDNALARFDATSGTLLQNGQTIEDDTGNVTVAGNVISGGTVDGRTLGTDGAKLDGIASGAEVNVDVFADNVFRVQGNLDATKQIALEADGITAATTRTITMPDTDVALSDIAINTAHAGTGGAAHADAVAAGASGFMTGAQVSKLTGVETAADVTDATNVAAAGAVMDTRNVVAGAGLTGGGTLAADRTLDVAANADGSIAINANDVQVGVLATDAQHGLRGGGTQHANVVDSGAAGFMTGTQSAKLTAIEALADVTDAANVNAAGAVMETDVAGGALGGTYPNPTVDGMTSGVLTNDVAHGVRGGGTQHADATTSVDGFMSSADKTKLDGLADPTVPSISAATTKTIGSGDKGDTLRYSANVTVTFDSAAEGDWGTLLPTGAANVVTCASGTATIQYNSTLHTLLSRGQNLPIAYLYLTSTLVLVVGTADV